ncbi:hypothetical protein [Mollivirus kamchatka]|nr:hypothetical protein [Mollivirus kamchatka]
MSEPKSLLHLAAAKVSAVAQSLGDDGTLTEWPFRLALGGDRLHELWLPHLRRPGQVLVRTRDPDEKRRLAAVCRLLADVGEELSPLGLLAADNDQEEDEGPRPPHRLAQGSFVVDPSDGGGERLIVSPSTWWHHPCHNVRGVPGWRRSFLRAEALACHLGEVMADPEKEGRLPNDDALASLFQHLFREAVISRHGAALESGLRSYELALDMVVRRGGKNTRRYPVRNAAATEPDYDHDERDVFLSLDVECCPLVSMSLAHSSHTYDYEPQRVYGKSLAAVGNWLLALAAAEEDPLALLVADAVLTRRHQTFGRIKEKRLEALFDGLYRIVPRLAQDIDRPAVTVLQLERAWLAAAVLKWTFSPIRRSLRHGKCCDENAEDESSSYVRFEDEVSSASDDSSTSDDYGDSMEESTESEEDTTITTSSSSDDEEDQDDPGTDADEPSTWDSMDVPPIERWCARSRAFALRKRERKARFYDILSSWLDSEVLHFVCSAWAHLCKPNGAARPNASAEDRRARALVQCLSRTLVSAEKACIDRASLSTSTLLDTVVAFAHDGCAPNGDLQRLLTDLGATTGPTESLANQLDRPLVRAFAASDAYTQERLAGMAFYLLRRLAIFSKTGGRPNAVFLSAVHPILSLDPAHGATMSTIHSLHMTGSSTTVARPIPLRSYWELDCAYVDFVAKGVGNKRVWQDRVFDKTLRDFLRRLFALADSPTPSAGFALNTAIVPCVKCNAKILHSLRCYAVEGVARETLYGMSRPALVMKRRVRCQGLRCALCYKTLKHTKEKPRAE